MQAVEIRITFYSILILLGVFQGFFISIFLLNKKSRGMKRNCYLGLFILALAFIILEILLNYTGVMSRVPFLDNFSEPLVFVVGPLLYLYIQSGLYPNKKTKEWVHFILFGFYLLYSLFYFLQPIDFRLQSYLFSFHPELFNGMDYSIFHDDPLFIRSHLNEIILLHFLFYLFLSIRILISEYKRRSIYFFMMKSHDLGHYRNSVIHFAMVLIIFTIVKIHFGRDLGDFFIASYIALIMYFTSFAIISRSTFFSENTTWGADKYRKSNLLESQKEEIWLKLQKLMETEKYYRSNNVSLVSVAEKTGETSHRVSQVINERFEKNFFWWLASYRIEEAKEMLSCEDRFKYKIEEIAEMVGYNSKSSFNKAFKELVGQTPAKFRDLSV